MGVGVQGQLSVLSVQNGCKLNFVGFQRVLSVLCRFLPLQFKNPSYVTDSLKSLSVSFCRLAGGEEVLESCKRLPSSSERCSINRENHSNR